ncbi:MAG TPA: hypothetical protein VGK19_13065 [Capsulimonadaceae bacterium]|jgi:hypothetical protein
MKYSKAASLRLGFLVVLAALVAMFGKAAMAQSTGPVITDRIPTIGMGVTTQLPGGGQSLTYSSPVLSARPMGAPNDGEFSAVMEFEGWHNDAGHGINKGDRQTILTGYTKAMGNNEIAAILPYEFLHVPGITTGSSFDDSEITFRHYSFDETDPSSLTTVYGAKLIVPTGSPNKFIGVGRWGLAPTVTVSKPRGNSLFYVGGNYTFIARKSGDILGNPYFLWLGGVTRVQPKTTVQYELTKFRAANGDGLTYTRIMVGPRFAVTPTAGIQVNLKHELEAGSHSTVLSIGYSNRM